MKLLWILEQIFMTFSEQAKFNINKIIVYLRSHVINQCIWDLFIYFVLKYLISFSEMYNYKLKIRCAREKANLIVVTDIQSHWLLTINGDVGHIVIHVTINEKNRIEVSPHEYKYLFIISFVPENSQKKFQTAKSLNLCKGSLYLYNISPYVYVYL